MIELGDTSIGELFFRIPKNGAFFRGTAPTMPSQKTGMQNNTLRPKKQVKKHPPGGVLRESEVKNVKIRGSKMPKRIAKSTKFHKRQIKPYFFGVFQQIGGQKRNFQESNKTPLLREFYGKSENETNLCKNRKNRQKKLKNPIKTPFLREFFGKSKKK